MPGDTAIITPRAATRSRISDSASARTATYSRIIGAGCATLT
jgi:hypothetical protein